MLPEIDRLLHPARAVTTRSWRDLERSLVTGELLRIHRGWYAPKAETAALRPEDRLLLRIRSVNRSARGTSGVFSHTSAGALWELPLHKVGTHVVHTTLRGGLEVHSTAGIRRHRDVLRPDDITNRFGMPCTTLERTVVDIARSTSLETSLSAADAAMRQIAWRDTEREYDLDAAAAFRARMREQIVGMAGKRGVRQARVVADLADGRAQLPGESISRIRLLELGFDAVRLQVGIPRPGLTDYHVDFGLDDVDAWGEFDGKGKYLDASMRGDSTPLEVLMAEKEREDWIRASTGRPVVRWGWEHIGSAMALAQRLTQYGIAPPR